MTHEQFSFWLEGYLAAGGTDVATIRAKLAEVCKPPRSKVFIRGPAFADTRDRFAPIIWPQATPVTIGAPN